MGTQPAEGGVAAAGDAEIVRKLDAFDVRWQRWQVGAVADHDDPHRRSGLS
jgi:hypothetical protein